MLLLKRLSQLRAAGGGFVSRSGSAWGSSAERVASGLVLALALSFAVGCASSPKAASGDGDAGVEPPDETGEETIEFSDAHIQLAPSEVATIEVVVAPARAQKVTFEVILTVDSPFDGFLLESEARVREDGTASVQLQAPGQRASFRLRASLPDGAQAELAVSVGSEGFGSIRVHPKYEGNREIGQWTASADTSRTCDDLESFYLDGPLVATGASAATIAGVPLGGNVAVTIRGGQLVAGCTTLTMLRRDEETEIELRVTERPIDVGSGTIALTLGVESSTQVFSDHLQEAITVGLGAFRDPEETEGTALLGRMSDALSSEDRDAFEQAAETHDLGASLDSLYGQQGPISTQLSALLTAAAGEVAGDDVFVGELQLGGASSQFLLTEVVGIPAAVSGFFQGSTWMASAESGDTLVLGGALTYEPLRWLISIAEDRTEEVSISDLVVASARCEEVGEEIMAVVGAAPFGDCEAECLVELCENAVSPVWDEMRGAGVGLRTLQLGVSGTASLFGLARVESMEGSWVGRLGVSEETSIAGAASATLISPD